MSKNTPKTPQKLTFSPFGLEVIVLFFSLWVMNLADAVLTIHAISSGLGTEANPLMAAVLELGYDWFLFIKLTIIHTALLVFVWSTKKRNLIKPRTMALYFVNAVYVLVMMVHVYGFFFDN